MTQHNTEVSYGIVRQLKVTYPLGRVVPDGKIRISSIFVVRHNICIKQLAVRHQLAVWHVVLYGKKSAFRVRKYPFKAVLHM
jgi:hypothetical protein